jgi:hypothetical protein
MSRASYRHRPLEACPRLHTRSTLARARWSRHVARRHPSATEAATRFRDGRAGVDRNCAKLRARLRPSVRFSFTADTASGRFTPTADTGRSVRGWLKADTEQNIVRI